MKRKREGGCLLAKRVCLPKESHKRKIEEFLGPNKKFCSDKDRYITQLENCVREMYKKMQELEYLLQMERVRSYTSNIHM